MSDYPLPVVTPKGVKLKPATTKPMKLSSGRWQTLLGEDGSVYEFNLNTGILIQTMGADNYD